MLKIEEFSEQIGVYFRLNRIHLDLYSFCQNFTQRKVFVTNESQQNASICLNTIFKLSVLCIKVVFIRQADRW